MRSEYEVVERHDLTAAEWRRLAPLLPPPAPRGRRPQDRRPVLNGILWVLATGPSLRCRFGRVRFRERSRTRL